MSIAHHRPKRPELVRQQLLEVAARLSLENGLAAVTLDAVAQEKWADYSAARDAMLLATSSAVAPWTCIATDDKKDARKAALRHILRTLAPADVAKAIKAPDDDVLFAFAPEAVERLAK